MFIPLAIAGLISRFIPTIQTFFKSAFYIPGVAAGVTMTLVSVWILYPLKSGLANQVFGWMGLAQQVWLGNVATALPSLIGISILSGWGGGIILYLAAMGGIPKSLYEASEVDAANGWGKFIHITIP